MTELSRFFPELVPNQKIQTAAGLTCSMRPQALAPVESQKRVPAFHSARQRWLGRHHQVALSFSLFGVGRDLRLT